MRISNMNSAYEVGYRLVRYVRILAGHLSQIGYRMHLVHVGATHGVVLLIYLWLRHWSGS